MLSPCHLVLRCESSRYRQRIEASKNTLATFGSGAIPLYLQTRGERRKREREEGQQSQS